MIIDTGPSIKIFYNPERETTELTLLPVFEALDVVKSNGIYIASFSVARPIVEKTYGYFSGKNDKSESTENAIYVYGREGNIPHMHILSDNKPDCCVRILENRYFIHPGKTRTLNGDERLVFNILMHSPKPGDENPNKITTWEFVKQAYYLNNMGRCAPSVLTKLNNAKDIPDYTTINDG